jgi:hypothetical protein
MQYRFWNGAMQTTAAPTAVASTTSLLTLLQFKPTVAAKVKGISFSFDGTTANTPVVVELIETDVAATVTAYVTADLTQLDAEALSHGDPTSTLIAVGTTSSGYTASGEGSTTAVRNLGGPWQLPPTGPFVLQWSLGDEPFVQKNKFCRIRVKAGTTVNVLCSLTVAF